MKVLIVSGHPNWNQSNANRLIIERVKNNLNNVVVRDLGALYPNHQINVVAEQAEMIKANVIVFQFPMYWYSVPALLKSYFDDILTYGFAYGSTGDKLHGKKWFFSFTVGEAGKDYNGEVMHKVEALLPPFQDLAKFSGMQWQTPVYSCGMLYIEGMLPAEVLDSVQQKAQDHAERLIQQIGAWVEKMPAFDKPIQQEDTVMDLMARNKAFMSKFETMINTADEKLAEELVWEQAPFYTPASPEPLYGGKGYLSVVHWMRQGFSDVQWKLEEIIADTDKVAVYWTLTGTHDGEFLGVSPTGNKLKTSFMNFYHFNEDGKIVKDIAAEGMMGILKALGLFK